MPALPDRIVEALIRLYMASRRHTHQLKDRYGVTAPQISAIQSLQQEGALPLSSLSQRIYLGQSTTSGIVDRLERDGLVARERSQVDRRVVRITLSEKGRDLADRLPRTSTLGEVRRVLTDLPEPEASRFLTTLEGILHRVDPTFSNSTDNEETT